MFPIRMDDFDYYLPESLIAQEPVEPRGWRPWFWIGPQVPSPHHHVRDLPDLLRPGDLLVFNENCVLRARLFARKPTGGKVEILLLRPRVSISGRPWRGRRIQTGLKLNPIIVGLWRKLLNKII